MITIQRVRVRWTAAARGAQHADLRSGLNRPVSLPASLPVRDLAFHDVLYDEADGYARRDDVVSERVSGMGMRLTVEGSAVVVDRIPGPAAYPRDHGKNRLFTLAPGEVGSYRANFRFTVTQCACNPSWFYEDWVVHVGNGPAEPDRFIHHQPDHTADLRVHLYGGTVKPAGGSARR